MIKLSQNKKIAISAISIFIISFSIMLFFLKNSPQDTGKGQASVMHSNDESSETANGDSHEPSSEVTSGEAKGTVDIEKAYRSYLKNTKNPIFVVDEEDKFTYVSSDFCDFMHARSGMLIGQLFLNYINNKDLALFIIDHNKAIQHGKEVYAIGPYRIKHENDEHLVLFDIYPILENGKVKHMVFGVKDITEKVEEMNDNVDTDVSPLDKTEDSPESDSPETKQDPRLMVDKNKLSYNINLIGRLFP